MALKRHILGCVSGLALMRSLANRRSRNVSAKTIMFVGAYNGGKIEEILSHPVNDEYVPFPRSLTEANSIRVPV